MKFQSLLYPCSALLMTGLCSTAHAQFSTSLGAEYTTGKYGSANATDIWYAPLALRYETGPVSFKVTVPWIQITNAGAVVPVLGNGGSNVSSASGTSGGTAGAYGCAFDNRKGATKVDDSGPCAGFTTGTGGGTTTTSRRRESGLGDIIAAGTYTFYREHGWTLDATGRIKFGTADKDKGLGTGKNDYAAHLGVNYDIGQTSVFGTLGYKWLGSPDGVSLKNVTYGSVGASYGVVSAGTLGLALDFATAAISGTPNPLELSAYYTHKFSPNAKLNGYVIRGLTNANPDWGGGLLYTHTF